MIGYAFLRPTKVMELFEDALIEGTPEALLKYSTPLERAFREIKEWATNEGGGRAICSFGNEICIEFPMDRIDELAKFIEKYEFESKCLFAVGVGQHPMYAFKAMQHSEFGGDKIELYTADMEGTPDDEFLGKEEQPAPSGDSGAGGYSLNFPGLLKDAGQEQATGNAAGKAQEGQNIESKSNVAVPSQDDLQEQQAVGQAPDLDEKDKEDSEEQGPSTKHKIVEALMMVKQYAPDIMRLKEINPKAYEAIKKIVDSIISMAQSDMGKAEEKVEEEISEDPEESASLEKRGKESAVDTNDMGDSRIGAKNRMGDDPKTHGTDNIMTGKQRNRKYVAGSLDVDSKNLSLKTVSTPRDPVTGAVVRDKLNTPKQVRTDASKGQVLGLKGIPVPPSQADKT